MLRRQRQIEMRDAGFVGDEVSLQEFVPKIDVAQMNYTEQFFWKILVGRKDGAL